VPDNVACAFELASGDVDAALARADLVIDERFSTNRLTATPLECRGLAAHFEAGRLTVWGAAKVPHFNRSVLARLLGLAEERVRLVETDVGGGFGARGEFYPEDYLIPFLAMRLGRPVGWIEDRREHLVAINHSRQQEVRVRAGVGADGTVLGLDVRIDNDHGAYVRTHGATVPEIGATLLPGPYRIPGYRASVRCVLTNKTPTGTFRGPGRFEGTFVRERLMDVIARRLGLDPAEVRRRNLVAPTELPFDRGTSGLGVRTVYDTGDYPALLDTALQTIDYASFRGRQADERRRGRWLGAGLAAFVEKSGLGPWEYARVEVDLRGRVTLYSGGASVGQGMETALAQITADGLGVHPDQVEVVHGDTDRVARGNGAFASRLTVVGGSAAFRAARHLRERVLTEAARLLEAAPDDLDLREGLVQVRGAPARALRLADVAQYAPSLSAEDTYQVEHMTYPGGVHACIVEVDLATGQVRIDRYAIAYDIGRAVNPMLVAGQLQGGLAQGIGGALLEELVYDPEGQPLTSTFMDYLLPTSHEVPDADLCVLETTPTPLNPLGVKGVGEGGCTGAGACIANAVEDALAPLGVTIRTLPLSPAEVRRLIREVTTWRA
jgi:carbon-monoxide dehydrogenase large subunit/6-hydroxypseudooxynicotine dehydrogenase subunit gamma